MHQPYTRYLRVACDEPCVLEHEGRELPAVAWNVSVLGLYLVVEPPFPERGAVIRVTFGLAGEPPPIVAQARVVWQNAPLTHAMGREAGYLPPGFGVEFTVLELIDRARIASRVKKTYPECDETGRAPSRR